MSNHMAVLLISWDHRIVSEKAEIILKIGLRGKIFQASASNPTPTWKRQIFKETPKLLLCHLLWSWDPSRAHLRTFPRPLFPKLTLDFKQASPETRSLLMFPHGKWCMGSFFSVKASPWSLRNKRAASSGVGARIGLGSFVSLCYILWVLRFIFVIHKTDPSSETLYIKMQSRWKLNCGHIYTYAHTMHAFTHTMCVCAYVCTIKANLPKSQCRSTCVTSQLMPIESEFSLWAIILYCKTHFMQENKNKQTNKTSSHHGTFKKLFPSSKMAVSPPT